MSIKLVLVLLLIGFILGVIYFTNALPTYHLDYVRKACVRI